jgi:hypothetical protein
MKETSAQGFLHRGVFAQNQKCRGTESANGSGASCPEPTFGVLRVLTAAIARRRERCRRRLSFSLRGIVLQQFLYRLCQVFLLFFGFRLRIECFTRHAAPREIFVRGVVHV